MGIVQNVLDDGIAGLQHNFVTARLEDLVKWSRSRSKMKKKKSEKRKKNITNIRTEIHIK